MDNIKRNKAGGDTRCKRKTAQTNLIIDGGKTKKRGKYLFENEIKIIIA